MGLDNNRGRSMGEGWSDFYARVLLSTPDEDVTGVYSIAGWTGFQLEGFEFTDNYYYGIRRFPYAVKTTTGGPNNRPHNPLTFADIDPAQIDVTDGAFPSTPFPFDPSATGVHNAGEVWCMALLEVRARIITRLGFAAGNQRILQLVTDGMKLTPPAPNFTQAKEAILNASQALGGTDTADVNAGFAARGMGFLSSDTITSTIVVETFDLPNAIVSDPFSVSDVTGDNDGFPEPGENVLLSIPVVNSVSITLNNVAVSVAGGGTVNYGSVANGQTVTNNVPYTIPAGADCGSLHRISITVSSDAGTQTPVTKEFRLGMQVGDEPATFSNNTTINLPASGTAGPSSPYPSNITVSGLTGNKIIKLEMTGISHTFPEHLDFLLVSPGGQKYIFLSDSGGDSDVSNLTFTLSDAAAKQPSTIQWVAGDFRPYNRGADDPFDPPAPASPYANAAPDGSDTFASAFGTYGAAMNGTWSLYADDNFLSASGSMAGWKLTFESDDYICSLAPSGNKRADFDGDGKTDLSVFRPADENWYVNRSSAGFTAITWGVSTDTLVPGDYDGDGKTDTAVFRPSVGAWYILKSSDSTFQAITWGASTDTVVPGDYDGDGKTDAAVFRPNNGVWYVLKSGDGSLLATTWGQNGDTLVPGDYDGDGKTDTAVIRSGTWYINGSTSGFTATAFGAAEDLPVPADYDGDGKDDIAVFRPSNGAWYSLKSSNVDFNTVVFGQSGDIPVPGDYDGDGKYDQAVVRSGVWYLNQSTGGFAGASFGFGTDRPIPKQYIP